MKIGLGRLLPGLLLIGMLFSFVQLVDEVLRSRHQMCN